MTEDERTDNEEGTGKPNGDAEPLGDAGLAEEQDAATLAAPPPPPPPPTAPVEHQVLSQATKTPEERKALLANTLQGQVASGGRIESQGDFQAVVVRGHRPNHLLHFFIGVFTLGLWWIVWFFIAVFGGEKRQMISVDEFGNVLVQRV